MTKLEIIEETAEYYSKNTKRRGRIKDVGCVYINTNTKAMCAVGRCLIEPEYFNEAYPGAIVDQFTGCDKEFNSYLKEKYQGHNVNFWQQLQDFHDSDINWDKKGLTETGKVRLKELKIAFKNN